MDKNVFVPSDFEVPLVFETDQFRLRMLSIEDVEKDYEAVIEPGYLDASWPFQVVAYPGRE